METGTFTIGSIGMTTFCTDKAFIAPEGVTCKIITRQVGNEFLYTDYKTGDIIPARTPLFIKGAAGTYTYTITECDELPPANNLLKGTFTEEETLVPTSYLYEVYTLSIFDDVIAFYPFKHDENNPGYYKKLAVGKAYVLLSDHYIHSEYYGKRIKYSKSTIGISFDCTKVISNMKHYSEREKWFHKLKWLLGRIKSCKCGNYRHIGKLDESGNESSFIKQLRVLFK